MNYIIKLSALIVLTTLWSCTDDLIETTNLDKKPVLLGYIYAGEGVDSIRITHPYYANNDAESGKGIDGLSVTLSNGKDSTILKNTGSGIYSAKNYIIKENETYKIRFEFGGKVVSSSTYVNPKQAISINKSELRLEKVKNTGGFPNLDFKDETVDITWTNTNNTYYFVTLKNTSSNPEYVNDFLAQFLNSGNAPPIFFETEPQIVNSYSISSRRELQTYGNYEINVYRLNTEYALLYQTVGNTSQSLKDAPTNVKNGLGIFTAATKHTLYLSVVK